MIDNHPNRNVGHEFTGEITAFGPDAAVRNSTLAEGQAVTAYPFSFCGTCRFCTRGLEQLCVSRSFCYSFADFMEAARLLAGSGVGLDPWIVEAPLADGGKWFDRLVDAPGDVAKVLLVPAWARGQG